MLLVKTKLGPSKIHDIGLFADEFIPKGKMTWKFMAGFDLELSEDNVQKLSPPAREQVLKYAYLDIKKKKYVLCGDDMRFINHSETPNTKTDEDAQFDIAIQDILPGEEMTIDYREFDAIYAQGNSFI